MYSLPPFKFPEKPRGMILGPYRLKNGDHYRGEWVEGLRHGRGVLISTDYYYEGINENDRYF